VVIWWPRVWYSQYETSAQRDANTAHCVCRRGPSSISLSNLKWIARFVQRLIWVPKFRNWVTWPRPLPFRRRFVFHMQAGSVLHLCTEFEAESSFRSNVIRGVPKFRHWVTWPKPRPFWRRFVFHTQAGCVVRLCTKFEADWSIHSKVIKGVPKLWN